MIDVQYDDLIGAPIIKDSTYHYGPKGGAQGDPLSKLLKVGNTGGIRPRYAKDGKSYAYVVLNSTNDSPWDDEHDLENNIITYHGDNDKIERDPRTTIGNRWLLKMFDEKAEEKYRAPILLFKSVDDEGGPKGVKRFLGVAAPSIDETGKPLFSLERFPSGDSFYENFVYKMQILDTGQTDLRKWLETRYSNIDNSYESSPDSWKRYMDGSGIESTPSIRPTNPSDHFTKYLHDNGFYYSPEFIESFLLGLKAKRFMIFCGGTGTGKTKLAQLYCNFIGARYEIVPVGSNWTDSKFMIGYKNAITGKYEITKSMELIIDSTNNIDKPFFLILDEMNLSHIERYFSEFISVMESGEPLSLPDGKELNLGRNLFIIGTMNLDETTYSISPKVLDRANVVVFEPADVNTYLDADEVSFDFKGDVNYLLDCMIPGNLQDYKARRLMSEIDDPQIIIFIDQVQKSMSMMGLPMGYRTIDEVSRYLYAAWEYEGKTETFDWRPHMCYQLRMKILPKIHGDITLKPGLISLKELLLSYPEMDGATQQVEKMIKNLEVRRYTSFIS